MRKILLAGAAALAVCGPGLAAHAFTLKNIPPANLAIHSAAEAERSYDRLMQGCPASDPVTQYVCRLDAEDVLMRAEPVGWLHGKPGEWISERTFGARDADETYRRSTAADGCLVAANEAAKAGADRRQVFFDCASAVVGMPDLLDSLFPN
jgi:hypothetical protein